MKRTFTDLDLRLNPKDTIIARRVIAKAAALGYDLVAVPLAPEVQETVISNLRGICGEVKVDFATRVNLVPKNREQLMRLLRKLRRRFEVICVACENKEVARQAAKDRRVDLLSFPSLDYRGRFFDWAEAELASNSLAALELDVKPLLTLEGPPRVRLLSNMRREVSIANQYHVPVVVSSGVGTEMLLRKPREIAAFVSLLGLDEALALDAVSTNPSAIVLRNREKLSHGFVAPGIRVIKEGRDC
jgi:RNase P/RNase MRP subunit p30